jgi:uncharacterized membrane protein YphA (DoxX/SURF4 family)
MAVLTRSITSKSNAQGTIDKANVALWTAQASLALLFLFAGSMKLMVSADQMAAQMDVDLPMWFMRFIGVCECAGALGLILPGVSRIRTGFTSLAACGLVVIMVGATTLTAIAGPVAAASCPLLVGLAAAYVAYGRQYVRPIAR